MRVQSDTSEPLLKQDGSCAAPTRQRSTVLMLVLIMVLAIGLRLYRLVPLQTGLLYAQDTDEGVHATVAQLALQGYIPYRDFFTVIPPVAIYLFMIVLRVFYHPWGSPVGLMAMRYVSVGYGLLTVLLCYKAGKMIGGRWSGLLAAAIVAVDGIVVAQDRRAMLESPSNLLSILAVLCCLLMVRDTRYTGVGYSIPRVRVTRLAVTAGVLCSLALLTKQTALVLPVLILPALLLRRQWRTAGWFVLSVLGSYALLTSFFWIACPVDYLKDTYLFHMLRPWDGAAHPLARLAEIWNYPWCWTTVRLALVGMALTTLAGAKVRNRDLWWVVLAWAGVTLLLLLNSRTYWATYFSQLAVPLSLLGGLVLNQESDHSAPGLLDAVWGLRPRSANGRMALPSSPFGARGTARLWPALQAVALALLLVFGYRRLPQQYATTRAALEQTKLAYVEGVAYINQHLPLDVPILTFEPNYTFLSGHPPAGARDGTFFVDSYGEMLYWNLDIPTRSVRELLMAWPRQERVGTQAVFHRQPAQEQVLAAFFHAPYTILDGRGLKQLTAETSDYIRDHSRLLMSAYAAEVRMRTASPERAWPRGPNGEQ